jgi:putative ABC transport system substrate-binding protein
MTVTIGRRELLVALGGAVAWPLEARAQQGGRMRRIGVLMSFAADDPAGQARLLAFAQELAQSGWIDGRNVRIDVRWGAVDPERIRSYAAELVALAPDVIVATGSAIVGSLLQATRTVPIVFVQVAEPVGAGFVETLARPGGNATGFMLYEYGIGTKWLELLKEIAPRVERVAFLQNPAIASGPGQFGAIQSAAPSLGVEVRPISVRDAGEFERAITAFARSSNGGLIVGAGTVGLGALRDGSSSWRPSTGCPRSIQTLYSPPKVGCSPMGLTASTSTVGQLVTLTAFSRARSQPTYRYKRRPSTSW